MARREKYPASIKAQNKVRQMPLPDKSRWKSLLRNSGGGNDYNHDFLGAKGRAAFSGETRFE